MTATPSALATTLTGLLHARGVPTEPPALREGPTEGALELSRTLDAITHLDVDELDRRLRALLAAEPSSRHVHYEMDFSEAEATDIESEAHLDLQEMFDGVRPTLHIAIRGSPARAELEALADLCGRFLDALPSRHLRAA